MGSYPFDELPVEDGDFDRSVEIGSSPASTSITLMRVGPKDGKLCYLEEIPASIRFDRCDEEFSLGDQKSKLCRHQWWRLVVKFDKTDTRILANRGARDHLVMTRWPYSGGWASARPFKNPNKKSNPERDKRVNKSFASATDFITAIESLPFDYFETGNYLTAGISLPEVSFFENPQNRNQDASLIFGVCNEPRQVEEDLLNSHPIKKLLSETEQNTIRFWPRDIGPEHLKLYPEVIDNAPVLMLCSIRQALAGPNEKDSSEFLGRPVTDLIDWIYRGLLNNANRSINVSHELLMDDLKGVIEQYNRGVDAVDDDDDDDDDEHDQSTEDERDA